LGIQRKKRRRLDIAIDIFRWIPGLRKGLAEDDGENYSAACLSPYPNRLFSFSTKSAVARLIVILKSRAASAAALRFGDPA
jgi:hypothetical protein